MKPLIYLLSTVVVFFAGSCSTDEVDVFDNHNYISFNFDVTDEATAPSTSFTFTFSDASVKEKTFEVPVTYAGRFVDTDMPFTWQVVSDESTAVEGVHYKIDSQTAQIIPANKNNGVAKITLLRTEDMKDKSFELTPPTHGQRLFQGRSCESGKNHRYRPTCKARLVELYRLRPLYGKLLSYQTTSVVGVHEGRRREQSFRDR